MPYRGRAGERDLGDAIRTGQRLADLLTVAVEDIHHSWRQQVGDHLHQYQNGNRRLLRRFQNDTIARSQCRCQFPSRHQQWKIPRNNLPDHAQRFVKVVADGVAIDVAGAALLGPQATGKITEVIHQQRDIGIQGLANPLAVVPGFNIGQRLEILFDTIGNFQQRIGALGDRCFIQRLVQIGGSGPRHLTDHSSRHRCNVLEILPFKRRHPLSADEILIAISKIEQCFF